MPHAPIGLPWFFYKYLGSILWAIALCIGFSPRFSPNCCPIAVWLNSLWRSPLCVEFSRLVPIAPIDAFRLTFAGKMLLGRYFSVKNIAAYILAIVIAATLDHFFITRQQQQNPALFRITPNPAARDTL